MARKLKTPKAGDKYKKLTVLVGEYGHLSTHRSSLCRCECGAVKEVRISDLYNGRAIDCGCGEKERITKANTRHGGSRENLYRRYYAMISRCKYDNEVSARYRSKGITVCDEWKGVGGYTKFREWSLANGYKENLSLDRIDNNGAYSPENCRWADSNTQARNRDTNIYITNNEKTMVIGDWVKLMKTSTRRIKRYKSILGNYSDAVDAIERGYTWQTLSSYRRTMSMN